MTEHRFHDAVSTMLTAKLKQYAHQNYTETMCYEIYNVIFESLRDLFESSNVKILNESMNYVAQQYYDAIEIKTASSIIELNPNIFTQRAKLENIPTKEIALLAMMFKGTDFVYPLYEEIKRRS